MSPNISSKRRGGGAGRGGEGRRERATGGSVEGRREGGTGGSDFGGGGGVGSEEGGRSGGESRGGGVRDAVESEEELEESRDRVRYPYIYIFFPWTLLKICMYCVIKVVAGQERSRRKIIDFFGTVVDPTSLLEPPEGSFKESFASSSSPSYWSRLKSAAVRFSF
jgi:hypothetical protein